MVKRYVKKSVTIEAIQWTGCNFDKIQEFVGFNNTCLRCACISRQTEIYIPTPEGAEYASIGDYIIKFSDGEIRTCGANFFESTYEEAKE